MRPKELGALITEKMRIPTVGIGAGAGCDGQVLVLHDMVGLFKRFTPKFVKVYADLYSAQLQAVEQYIRDVRSADFPGIEHSFGMSPETAEALRKQLLP